MDPGPKLIFVRVDVGDHLVLVSVEFRCEKSRGSLEDSVCAFQFAVFSAQTPHVFLRLFRRLTRQNYHVLKHCHGTKSAMCGEILQAVHRSPCRRVAVSKTPDGPF